MKINIFIKKLIIITLGFMLSTVVIASEEAKYNIVHKTNIYEIRLYTERLAVETKYNSNSSAFRKLFKYISGANNNSQKIEMTIPVTQIKKNNTNFLQFILPSRFNKKTIPTPSNSDVKVSIIEEGYFAVIEYSGRPSDKNFIEYSQILKEKLLKDKILIKGSAIKATYNGPFTLPLLRRNEAMFNVRWER
ncbi:heme-binding protein [Candidatus Pelagibacter sp.]|nr:heme-binding protein [Candidatus Pelagibacter sp.]